MCIRDSMGRLQQCRSTLIQLSLFLLNENDYGGFSDVGLVSLSRFLHTLTHIQDLSIRWCVNNITSDDGCCEVMKALLCLSSLTRLHLQFPRALIGGGNSITDKTMKSMYTTLRLLVKLSNLSLDLSK
eukprot:TRINITY_DN4119_c0_g1_i1.p1 TRINITY_DN4119_c0_g1~~TRINITY_DN4119_c0_g1_i1.p1  ORF type:complete len:128 (+),score=2.65 TRINITY_DN4119_c0_g1_i1:66-449(+)